MLIRNYTINDKPAVLELLRLNTPAFFAPEEEADFVHYLDHELFRYFVIEDEDRAIGCGGINVQENGSLGVIAWDMLHPEYRGRGFGMKLLTHRIAALKAIDGIERIKVRTTQLAWKFYEKGGFVLTTQEKDFWAPGFDLYEMILKP